MCWSIQKWESALDHFLSPLWSYHCPQLVCRVWAAATSTTSGDRLLRFVSLAPSLTTGMIKSLPLSKPQFPDQWKTTKNSTYSSAWLWELNELIHKCLQYAWHRVSSTQAVLLLPREKATICWRGVNVLLKGKCKTKWHKDILKIKSSAINSSS